MAIRYIAAASATALALAGVVGVEAGRAREPLERLAAFEPAVHPEERVEGFEQRQRRALVVLGQDPLGRGAKVVQLAPQLVPRDRELRPDECRLPLQEHRRVVTRMPLAGVRLVGGRRPPAARPRTGAAARAARSGRSPDGAGATSTTSSESRRRSAPVTATAALAIEAAAEHGQPRERVALLVGEQAPRLVDGRSQAAVPLRHVAHRRGEEVDVALDLVRDLGAGEHGHPRGRELDAERHAVDEPADAERLRVPGVVEGEARHDLRGPLDEEAHCRPALPFPFSARPRPSTSNTHSLWTLSRSREVVRSSTCGARSITSPSRPGALDEMLEVVEHEQRRALAEVVEQLVLRREAAVRAVDGELDRLGDGRREELRRGDGGERDEVDAVRVAVDPASGGLEREPRLARSARADEREQAAAGILQQPVDRFELRRPADERRSWQRAGSSCPPRSSSAAGSRTGAPRSRAGRCAPARSDP